MSIQTITIIFNRKLIEKERYTLMSKEYYTIIRKYYGLPDYLNTDLSKKLVKVFGSIAEIVSKEKMYYTRV